MLSVWVKWMVWVGTVSCMLFIIHNSTHFRLCWNMEPTSIITVTVCSNQVLPLALTVQPFMVISSFCFSYFNSISLPYWPFSALTAWLCRSHWVESRQSYTASSVHKWILQIKNTMEKIIYCQWASAQRSIDREPRCREHILLVPLQNVLMSCTRNCIWTACSKSLQLLQHVAQWP